MLEIIEFTISLISAILGTISFFRSQINREPHLSNKVFRFLKLFVVGIIVFVVVLWLFVLPQASTINISTHSTSTKKIQSSNKLVSHIQKFCIILLEFLSAIQWFTFVLMVWLFSKIYSFTRVTTKIFLLLACGIIDLLGVSLIPRKHS
ncbi:hypothetical protein BC008_07575 [Mastigocoleus testarum BC008]|uniref:Uncharacterized protein n=1 Tax=Mastigocoleus testarum BC008 TaxID=371196 RepID=A0A0V7ZBM9_9CYAN|nr:hypothetical protein BC008_07575 [Mastigocoleus testarum BC008]